MNAFDNLLHRRGNIYILRLLDVEVQSCLMMSQIYFWWGKSLLVLELAASTAGCCSNQGIILEGSASYACCINPYSEESWGFALCVQMLPIEYIGDPWASLDPKIFTIAIYTLNQAL